MADHITHHPCGASLLADVGALVEHLATCPKTDYELGLVCRRLIQTVSEATRNETTTVSPAEMADMRDAGKTLRDIAAVSGVAPETVRRRIAKHKAGGES